MLILTTENFKDEVIKSSLPILVDFYADWCGPCQMVAPVIAQLAKEFEGKIKFGKFDVDKAPQLVAKYGIMSIPTVILFKDGQEVGRKTGFEGKETYVKLISNV